MSSSTSFADGRGTLGIDVDPLVIVGRFGEQVYIVRREGPPTRWTQERAERGERACRSWERPCAYGASFGGVAERRCSMGSVRRFRTP